MDRKSGFTEVAALGREHAGQRRCHVGEPSHRLAHTAAPAGQGGGGLFGFRGRQRAEHVQPVDPGQRQSRVAVTGGGLKYFFSRRWGVRLDARTYLGRRTVATSVSASPVTLTSSQPQGATATFTTPSVQFSNNIGVGRSSLALPVSDFRTFSGDGTQSVVNVTGGVIFRFR